MLGLVGAEIAFRVLEPVPRAQLLPLPYPNSDVASLVVGDTYIRFDTELGWTTGPGASAVDDGILYRANAAGFRAER